MVENKKCQEKYATVREWIFRYFGPKPLALVFPEYGASTPLMRAEKLTRQLPPEALAPRALILILPGRIFPIGNTPRSFPGTGAA
jgi:hypothetical protein